MNGVKLSIDGGESARDTRSRRRTKEHDAQREEKRVSNASLISEQCVNISTLSRNAMRAEGGTRPSLLKIESKLLCLILRFYPRILASDKKKERSQPEKRMSVKLERV